jgi:hypothetical protein
MATKKSPEFPFTFKDGSTHIIVTYRNSRVIGGISPHAMALASPVWEKFVFPPFGQNPQRPTASQINLHRCIEAGGHRVDSGACGAT